MKKALVVCTLFVVLALAGALPALAQDSTDYAWRQDKFYLDLGFFLTSVSTSAEVDSTFYGRGTSVSMENDLGLQSNPTTGRLDFEWRFTNRQQLAFSWYQINRSAFKNLASPVSWGDYTFQTGTGATSKWDSTFYELAYRFGFVQTANGEFGVAGGVSYLQQKASISGTAVLGHGSSTSVFYASRSNSLDAPVPFIGIYGLYQFTPQWMMKGYLNYLKVNVSGVDGSYTDAALRFDYYPWKNAGFGLGWYYDKYDVSANKTDYNGSFTYTFNGPEAYVVFRF